MSFDKVWKTVSDRTQRGVTTVQDRAELEYIHGLLGDCSSYLEVGTAEGNSLYVLSHAVWARSCRKVVYIDLCEAHTLAPREELLQKLYMECTGLIPTCISGNSHEPYCIRAAAKFGQFDAVMVDAGHSYEDVIADAIAYGHLAKKYIIFHDVCMPDVRRALEWYAKHAKLKAPEYFIKSENFGYGILRL